MADEVILNWFGVEAHPTDEYIHWSLPHKEKVKKADRLRKAYDKIKEVGLEDELKELLDEAWSEGRNSGFEDNNPDI